MTVDYRDTVFLPSTPFPMRGRLPDREPKLLERWKDLKIYYSLRERRAGKQKFVLHDGPPYANGHLHIGHALNKILKDIVVRSHSMLGKDSLYVPGWDCHGLPIEWKMEQQYRAEGKDKDDVPVIAFRRQCREFAEKWIDVQREEFKRLGVEGDWDEPYVTMAYAAEAQIVREIAKFAMNGGMYRGARPVLWSVVEKTALADAEVEYHDHVSATIWVRFPVVETCAPTLAGASVVIWTTTPWTMPGNRAIAYAADCDYVVFEVTSVGEDGLAVVGEKLAVAGELLDRVCADAKIEGRDVLATFKGAALDGTVTHHPLNGQGYDFQVRLFPGDFVTIDQGTGFVHIAPGHGADDYEIGRANDLEIPFTVREDGSFHENVPLFAGKLVYDREGKPGDANPAVQEAIRAAGGLLAFGRLRHSYPHSWRSKAPLIFRNTPQWFISMETNDLRAKALRAIGDTRWAPATGETRIRSMIETRPDWCVSRQRVWGVPLPLFVNKTSGALLRDQAVFDRVAEAFERESGDAWFNSPPARFLGDGYDPDAWEQVTDVVEVWFDSGSTHSFVLEQRPDQQWPASLYLEGSDQHRGWFHTSLLESCGTRGRAPYEAVLTHGFTLDEEGRKMSKSLGNVVSPQAIVKQYGADILRLWVVTTEYSEDQRIGPEILKQVADIYRRFRNTLRFLLGNLHGFTEAERVVAADMPELERWVLHRLSQLDAVVRKGAEDFDFHAVYRSAHDFCTVDLSAFYFDVRKDSLYCDRSDNATRRAARTVLDETFRCLTAWLAPFLPFTAEEAWLAWNARGDDFLQGKPGESVHFGLYPELPDDWRDHDLAERWRKLREVRRAVTGALERERAGKRIGSSLQAHPTVHVTRSVAGLLATVDLATLCITSDVSVTTDAAPDDAFRLEDVAEVAVTPGIAEGRKCERCWRVLTDVGTVPAAPGACGRCADAVSHLRGRAA